MHTETYIFTCRCKFKFEMTTYREPGYVEDEEYNCCNCGEPHVFRASMPIMDKDVKILEEGIPKQPQDLDPREVYRILSAKGADTLHHANTALTSLTFLKEKRLLSRKYVADRKLPQTSQYTDKSDQNFGIDDDIFMDAVDIHSYASDMNKYGPILFKFPLAILNSYPFVFVRVTRQNPSDWYVGQPIERRYFLSAGEFEEGYTLGNFSSMLIFPYIDGQFPLPENLRELMIDSPKLQWGKTGVALNQEMLDALKAKRSSVKKTSSVRINLRECNENTCSCKRTYESNSVITEKMFRIS